MRLFVANADESVKSYFVEKTVTVNHQKWVIDNKNISKHQCLGSHATN